MTAHEVIAAVAHEHGVRISDVRGRSRQPFLVSLRQNIAKQLRGEPWKLSLPAIGRLLGRHHTSILYYLQKDKLTGGIPCGF